MKRTNLIGLEKIFKIVLLAVVSALIMFGCSKEKAPSAIAKVDGKPVTRAEFDAYLKFKRMPAGNPAQKAKLLDQYLERTALASAVEKQSLLDKSLLQAELDDFRKEMLISRYFEAFLKDKVTDQAVKNYYNTHAADYEQKMVHVAHILIRTNKAMTENERAAKLTAAQEIYSKIRAGQDFSEMAKTYSEDRVSSGKGGDIGWIKEGSIHPVFSKKVFSMKPGEVSEPFETPFGFHVVKLIEGPKVVKRPFNAVAGDIRYRLRNEARNAEIKRLMAGEKIKKKGGK